MTCAIRCRLPRLWSGRRNLGTPAGAGAAVRWLDADTANPIGAAGRKSRRDGLDQNRASIKRIRRSPSVARPDVQAWKLERYFYRARSQGQADRDPRRWHWQARSPGPAWINAPTPEPESEIYPVAKYDVQLFVGVVIVAPPSASSNAAKRDVSADKPKSEPAPKLEPGATGVRSGRGGDT